MTKFVKGMRVRTTDRLDNSSDLNVPLRLVVTRKPKKLGTVVGTANSNDKLFLVEHTDCTCAVYTEDELKKAA